jgi:hypothetical protein
MKLSALLIPLLMLAGCGGAATRARIVTDYPDGRRVTADYWIAGGHVLADPSLGDMTHNADGSWTIHQFKSAVDNEGLGALMSGVVQGIGKFFKP